MNNALIPKDAVLELLRSRLVRARSSAEDDAAARYLAEVLECVGVMVPVAQVSVRHGAPNPSGRIVTLGPWVSEA